MGPKFLRERVKIEPVHGRAARAARALYARAEQVHGGVDVTVAALSQRVADRASKLRLAARGAGRKNLQYGEEHLADALGEFLCDGVCAHASLQLRRRKREAVASHSSTSLSSVRAVTANQLASPAVVQVATVEHFRKRRITRVRAVNV
jgi:hypothetical protein